MKAAEKRFLPASRAGRHVLFLETALLISYILPATPILSGTPVNSGARFVMAFGGAAIIVGRGWAVHSSNRTAVVVVGLAWSVLCLSSYAWSWAPPLTVVKGLLAIALFVTATLGGAQLGRIGGKDEFQYFPWFVLGTIWAVASSLGMARGAETYMGGIGFRGVTSNENMFASVTATVAFPMAEYLRSRAYFRKGMRAWVPKVLPWVWGALVFLSGSRGGMLLFFVAGAAWWISRAAAWRIPWLPLGAAALLVVSAMMGLEPMAGALEGFLYKRSEALERDVFSSRRANWDQTIAATALVGPLGAGFGVSADQPFRPEDFSWASMSLYGREQGSAWLAVREQLGIPGQVLFALLGGSVAALAVRAVRGIRQGHTPPSAGVLAGVALGLWLLSFFEAWTLAPGSAESGFFWLALGQASGLVAGVGKRRPGRP